MPKLTESISNAFNNAAADSDWLKKVAYVGATAVGTKLIYDNGGSFARDYFAFMSKDLGMVNEPNVLEYPESIDMFNGLETIGGDGSRYKEAISWFEGMDVNIRWKSIVACTILLEKPTGVALSGLTGPQKQKFKAKANKKKEALGVLKTICQASIIPFSKSEDEAKKTIGQLLAAVNPYVVIEGEGDAAGPTLGFSAAELGIPEKIFDLLQEAIESAGPIPGQGIHYANIDEDELDEMLANAAKIHMKPEVANYLPKITSREMASRDKKEVEDMVKSRAHWHPAFHDVNVSRAKVVALLALQYQKDVFQIQFDWIKKYHGRPFGAKIPDSANAKTKEIWNTMVKKFTEDHKLYSKKAKKVFGSKWYSGLVKVPSGPKTTSDDEEETKESPAGSKDGTSAPKETTEEV